MAGAAVLTVADTIARSFLLAVEKRGEELPENLKHLLQAGSAAQEASSLLAPR